MNIVLAVGNIFSCFADSTLYIITKIDNTDIFAVSISLKEYSNGKFYHSNIKNNQIYIKDISGYVEYQYLEIKNEEI